LGTVLFLGLDIHALSVSWPTLPEIKKLIMGLRIEDARRAAAEALNAATSQGAKSALARAIGGLRDLPHYSGS